MAIAGIILSFTSTISVCFVTLAGLFVGLFTHDARAEYV